MKHCLCCQVASQAEKGKCAWPEESSGHGPGMLHPAKVALSSEQLLWPCCTRTHLLAPGPGHGGDEPLGAHVTLSPHQGRVQLWDWCWWEAAGWPDTSLHICLCLCVLLSETGAAPASPSPAHSWVFASLGMGEANPAGHWLLLLLPVLCVEIPEPRKDKCAVWGCRADGWSPWVCTWTLGDGVCRPRPEHGGAPSPLPAMAKPRHLGSWRHPSSGKHQCQIPREHETKQIQSKTRISKLCSWRAPGGAQGGTG